MVNKKCINPGEIKAADLLAYFEGDVKDMKMSAHVTACTFCQAEGEAFLETAVLLETAVYRQSCPDNELLWDYVNQLLAADAPQRSHIAVCVDCQRELNLIRKAAYEPKRVAEEGPEFGLVEQFKENGRRLLEAFLVPGQPQLKTTLRGQTGDEQLYQTADHQIIIVKIPPIAKEEIWCVAGQLMSKIDPLTRFIGQVSVQQGEMVLHKEPLDELGYFECGQLSPGNYRLQIELTSQEASFTIPEFPIP